ncbi:MAG: ribosome biogenesis GTP-binding protein YihA/YsxC [Defluviitaleaceae bacterium]|nr:ribosome biogenesis GTP-binding protein YihA/YsxC [Defluviitaleaceae bacterium]
MNVVNVALEAVCVGPEGYPVGDMPEFAFVGRSNVGKSSLINCMINRKALARTSAAPGKTRTINFYNVENQLYFVDLPGYGYAKAPKTEKEKWGKMIEKYLLGRENLRAIICLIDIRHDPSELDLMMLEWLAHYDKKMILVLTKADKLTRNQLPRHIANIKKQINLAGARIIPFSKETKLGKDDLWNEIIKH